MRRQAFPWTKQMTKQGSNHNTPSHGLGYEAAAPKEDDLLALPPGRPEVEPGELRPDGALEAMPPGGVFAPVSGQHICAAHELCLGITAQQARDELSRVRMPEDDLTVNIEVHFELHRASELHASKSH